VIWKEQRYRLVSGLKDEYWIAWAKKLTLANYFDMSTVMLPYQVQIVPL